MPLVRLYRLDHAEIDRQATRFGGPTRELKQRTHQKPHGIKEERKPTLFRDLQRTGGDKLEQVIGGLPLIEGTPFIGGVYLGGQKALNLTQTHVQLDSTQAPIDAVTALEKLSKHPAVQSYLKHELDMSLLIEIFNEDIILPYLLEKSLSMTAGSLECEITPGDNDEVIVRYSTGIFSLEAQVQFELSPAETWRSIMEKIKNPTTAPIVCNKFIELAAMSVPAEHQPLINAIRALETTQDISTLRQRVYSIFNLVPPKEQVFSHAISTMKTLFKKETPVDFESKVKNLLANQKHPEAIRAALCDLIAEELVRLDLEFPDSPIIPIIPKTREMLAKITTTFKIAPIDDTHALQTIEEHTVEIFHPDIDRYIPELAEHLTEITPVREFNADLIEPDVSAGIYFDVNFGGASTKNATNLHGNTFRAAIIKDCERNNLPCVFNAGRDSSSRAYDEVTLRNGDILRIGEHEITTTSTNEETVSTLEVAARRAIMASNGEHSAIFYAKTEQLMSALTNAVPSSTYNLMVARKDSTAPTALQLLTLDDFREHYLSSSSTAPRP